MSNDQPARQQQGGGEKPPARRYAIAGHVLEALIANCAPATLLSIAVDLTLATEQIVTRPLAQWRLDTLDLHKRPAIFSILAQ